MKFKGGIHPQYHKVTADRAIRAMPLLERYIVPVGQHIGAPGEVIVEKGQEVQRGEPLTRPAGFVSVPVHAPTSGKIKKIDMYPHPLGRPQLGIELIPDGQDTWYEGLKPVGDWRTLDADTLRNAIRDAGIVGMGGATFPTHVKLSPPREKPIDLLILNGAECEPYLTSDHRIMLEYAEDVNEGIGLMMRVLGVTKAIVGIESNKEDARLALAASRPANLDISYELLETKYPQGSEKHLIYALCGRTVPAGGLPMDVGVVVQNVGTAAACLEAVRDGRPMTERVVTVTGSAVAQPENLLVRVGTPLQDVIDFCGGLDDHTGKIIYGGPMMGMVQFELDSPVLKGTSGILCLREDEVSQFEGGPCIRCGNCVDVCPMFLVPAQMGVLVERSRWEDLGDYHVTDCIECGSCAYVCPSRRPLVQFFKRGKLEWREHQKKQEAQEKQEVQESQL
jgi:electron transport complex protein RnfC|nr:electron transport complex subunit RsxC [Candidatus Krumholzibacteria bacterium]